MLRCTHCKDQLAIKGDGWPYWLHLSIREGFAAIHKDCTNSEAGKWTSYESISFERDD